MIERPFPHVVVDGFWDAAELREAERELRLTGRSAPWEGGDSAAQTRKYKISDPLLMPPVARSVVRALNSPEVLVRAADELGLGRLLPDHGYWGGGVHQTWAPGRLAMHVDFNRHPTKGWHRAVNLLLYMNRGWRPEHGGQLELWDREMMHPVVTVEPVFNRAVIFRLGPTSWHGHPNPWQRSDEGRLSLAAYYYQEADASTPEFRDVQWRELPGGGYERG